MYNTTSNITNSTPLFTTSSNTTQLYSDSEYVSKITNMNVEQDIKIKQLEKTITEQNLHIDDLLNEIVSNKKLHDSLNIEYTNLNLEYTKLKQQNTNIIENASNYETELDEAKNEIQRLNKVISVI